MIGEIPREQLQTWSNPGPQVLSERTRISVENALSTIVWPKDRPGRWFLQGSYRNHTNIRGDSDVDMVVVVDNFFIAELEALPEGEKAAYKAWVMDAPKCWESMYALVLATLEKEFPGKVKPGRIAINVKTPHLVADVVVAIGRRIYKSFNAAPGAYEKNVMTFRPSGEERWITNYPQRHFDNGATKNADTLDRFKPTVRMFKNAFGACVDKGLLQEGIAFSYAIECLVYNAPSELFAADEQDRFANIVNWFGDHATGSARLLAMKRVSGVGNVVGDDPEQWKQGNAEAFIEGLKFLWHEWG
jgi:hypothetical protein